MYSILYFREQQQKYDTFPLIVKLVQNESHLLPVSYSEKNFRFVVNTAED